MKKRLSALVLGVVMTLSLGMTAFAAPSSSVDNSDPVIPVPPAEEWADVTTTINGQTVVLDADDNYARKANAKQKAELDKFDKIIAAGDAAGLKKFIEERTKKTYTNFKGWGGADISLPESVSMPAGGIEVTLGLENAVSAGDEIIILHLKDDGTWEYIKGSVKDGKIVAKFTSLSPVLWFIVDGVKDVSTSNNTNAAPTKSPKTGETAGVYAILGLGVVCLAGACVQGKRKAVR